MSCESCEKLRKEGNSVKYCSQSCYYKSPQMQEYFNQKDNAVKNLRKQIFDKIYNAGKNNIIINENDYEISSLLDELENTYY